MSYTSTRPLLVFLHYWGGSSSTWHKVISLAKEEYPILSLDLRGWGQSFCPDDPTAYSISIMADDVAGTLEKMADERQTSLDNGFILVGHSMGGKVALATIPALSDRIRGKLHSLVLVAPAPPTPLKLPGEIQEQQQKAYATEESVVWNIRHILANMENLSAADVEMIVRDSLSGHEWAKKAWPSYGMQEDITDSVARALSSLQAKKQITAKILVGGSDLVEPRERVESGVARFLQENGVKVSLRVVEGVKHLLPLECPKVVYEMI
ncbi:hypothetical protein ASPZODRAFT_63655 [Penicilliopsis zonata CBS 506.65]|uniref:AB hydrolase-1 domain-containing protein n=1 Tax=Penicilliopsis zonata CBS 506.65 TaxID=1073090 RepID=A0A1L9SL16_9EURO|nr:hypothetical protein ASPZODRAFT_63655 [Penicilliopsis zonata CBS 506.65]OJJ47813.1 hypothetical protein ASPZODRAFT_63655 [Penicilliopsis zonata CBS 506.65]